MVGTMVTLSSVRIWGARRPIVDEQSIGIGSISSSPQIGYKAIWSCGGWSTIAPRPPSASLKRLVIHGTAVPRKTCYWGIRRRPHGTAI
jgi:hypothetical protein